MKKAIGTAVLLLVLGLTFSSFRDTKKAESIGEALEHAGDALELAAAENI